MGTVTMLRCLLLVCIAIVGAAAVGTTSDDAQVSTLHEALGDDMYSHTSADVEDNTETGKRGLKEMKAKAMVKAKKLLALQKKAAALKAENTLVKAGVKPAEKKPTEKKKLSKKGGRAV